MNNLVTLISGGQSGVDIAAVDLFREHGLTFKGFIPKGRRCENGVISSTYTGFRETESTEYADRTFRNVRLADGILILHQGIIDKGTNLTITLANIYSRPLKVTDLSKTYDLTEIKNFIFRFQNLMIAGPRESHSPGIYNKTKHFLRQVMRKS